MDFTEAWDNTCSSVGEAARMGRAGIMEKLIKMMGKRVDIPDNRAWRPLHEAAYGNHRECLQILLKHEDTDVNWRSHEGKTALLIASERGHVDAVDILLTYKADPNIGNNEHIRPLLAATTAKSVECVKLLLQHGADVNAKDYNGVTALHEAAKSSDSCILQELLNNSAVINIYDYNHLSPLFVASMYGSVSNVKILCQDAIEFGRPDLLDSQAEDGATPLIIAASLGHESCVKVLMDNGADVNMKGDNGLMALHVAVEEGLKSIVELLLPATSRIKLSMCCFDPIKNVHDPSYKLPVVHQVRQKFFSPLHIAIDNDRLACLEVLLKGGLKPDTYLHVRMMGSRPVYPECFYTPLSWALLENKLPFAEILLRAGSSPNSDNPVSVKPPLIAALESGNPDGLELLLRYDVELGILNPEDPDLPYDLVVASKHPACLRILLHRGVQPSLSKIKTLGQLPWEKFCSCGIMETDWSPERFARIGHFIELLFQYGANQITPNMMTELHDVCMDYGFRIKESTRSLLAEPQTLTHLCRLTVRQNILQNGYRGLEQKVNSLLLPTSVKELLLFSN